MIAVLAGLLVPFTLLALRQAADDRVTVDEAVYIASGVTALTRHDLRLVPEQPPAAKVLAAVPALLGRPVVPDSPSWDEADWFGYTEDFVDAQQEVGRLDRVTFLARLVPVLLAAGTSVSLYLLGARLFGGWEGLLAAGLWLTLPLVLGHGHLATTDVPFALATVLAVLALTWLLERPGRGRALSLGAAVGAALLVRYTGLVLAGAVVAVVVVAGRRDLRRAALTVAVVLGVAWATVWVGVRVVAPAPPGGEARDVLEGFVRDGRDASLLARVGTSVPWPLEYRAGLAYLELTATERPSYVLGRASEGRSAGYWAGAMAVKLPPTTVLVLAAGLGSWALVPPERRRRAALVLGVPAGALLLATVAQPRPIGTRYLLPVLALALVAAGPGVRLARWRAGQAALAALLVGQAALFLTASPHALAWTSPLFRPGYRAISDSDLDWGQDLGRLAEWSATRRPTVAFVGPRGVGIEDIPGATELDPARPDLVEGWLAVSASALTAYLRDDLAWLRAYCPVGTIGGSILLYRFDEPPEAVDDPPAAPVAPCPAGPSVRRP
ncbi:MAG: glycosyltransferase family 39 protein [Acidimicrobiales bacterium]|nr:glycosyltransferase family 39 protein [Acidimicrobiales bacterium]